MRYRSVPSPDAEADISSAVRWYQGTSLNLAFRFTLETVATRRRIERFPFQFPIVYKTVRRALLKRFPYSMYFELKDDEASVIAVVHQRRNPAVWMARRRE